MKLALQDVCSCAHKHEHCPHDDRVQKCILKSYTLSHLCEIMLVPAHIGASASN